MKILFVGDLNKYTRTLERKNALVELGHQVVGLTTNKIDNSSAHDKNLSFIRKIFYKLGYPLDESKTNKALISLVENNNYDIVWIEKGLTIRPKTLLKLKKCNKVLLVYYTNDNMSKKHNQSMYFKRSIKYYDICLIIKGYDKSFFYERGCNNVIEIDRAHDKNLLNEPISNNVKKYDVIFIGTYELDRFNIIKYIIENKITVHVFGNNWPDIKSKNLKIKNKAIYGDEFVKKIKQSRIVLNFLRKANNDVTTGRTFEIPATGSFMLSERTSQQKAYFTEGKEAEYFSTKSELLSKIKYYLKNNQERESIATNAKIKCINKRYDHNTLLKNIISRIYDSNS
tara:strand:- start:170 stop:1192 length:1023 start_codon:yes stop_codon:yes gene_type:complete